MALYLFMLLSKVLIQPLSCAVGYNVVFFLHGFCCYTLKIQLELLLAAVKKKRASSNDPCLISM